MQPEGTSHRISWPYVEDKVYLWTWLFGVPLAAYTLWQVLYFLIVNVLRRQRLLRDPGVMTSYRYFFYCYISHHINSFIYLSCLASAPFRSSWWFVCIIGNFRRRPRKQITYGGVWVDCLGIKTDSWCTFYVKPFLQWQPWHSLSPSSYHTNSTWFSKYWRFLRQYGMEEASC